ncbi:MAG TPA: DUF4340 domain-containing protein [Polyangiales bacterium]|nr:DUF4340 domain-containing protein [Polyangiales bacterium]
MGRTSIILGALALALLAFILFFERGTVSTGEREGRKGQILESFVRDRVERIEIQRKGVTTVLVRKQLDANDDSLAAVENAGFHVEKPYAAKADRDAVESLLGALEWVTPRRSLGEASKEDLARFGLDKPRYRVSFQVGRERRSFQIGSPSGDGAGAYLLTPDDKRAYVVGKDLVEALDHEPTYFHTKELHSGVSVFSTEKLKLGELLIQRRADQFWIERPEPILASGPMLTEVVNALDGLKATRFIADKANQPAQYGLDAPRFTLALDSKVFDGKDKSHNEHLELRVGAACAGHAAESYIQVGSANVMCASDADLAKLQKPPAELREKRLLVLEDGEIRSCELQAGKRRLSVEEKDEGHTFRISQDGKDRETGTADDTALRDWYKTLRGLQAETFEESPTVALGTPVLTATFARGKDKQAYVIQVGRVDGERVAVTRGGEKLVAWYPKRALDALGISSVRFRKAKLLDEDSNTFNKLTLRAAGRPAEVIHKQGDRYVFDEPRELAGSAAERANVDEIVRLVSKLEVVRFIADGPSADHQLTTPAYVIGVDYAGGRMHTLRIGAATDGGRYAQLDSDPAVFLVAPALVRQIEGPLVSRGALAVPLEEMGDVEIIAAGGAPQKVATNDASYAALARAIATLRASRVLAYGKPQAAEGMEKPQLRVVIQLKAGGQRTLSFGNAVGEEANAEVYARRADLDVAFSVPRASLDGLRPPAPK